MNVLETTEDAVIKLCAGTLKVALYATVTTASQEMDSPVQVSYVFVTHSKSTTSNGLNLNPKKINLL